MVEVQGKRNYSRGSIVRQILIFLVFVWALFFGFGLNVFSQAQSITDLELNITPMLIKSLPFTITPKNIFVGNKLTFTLGPALSKDNQPLPGLVCDLWVLPPRSNRYVVLRGLTNPSGYCIYETDKSLSSQGLQLITANSTGNITQQNTKNQLSPSLVGGNTNLNSINSVLGNGVGFGTVIYQGTLVTSNNDNYSVGGGVAGTGVDNNFIVGNFPGDSGNDQFSPSFAGNEFASGFNRGLFSFLPRTGGYAASIIGFSVAGILAIYLLTLVAKKNKKS